MKKGKTRFTFDRRVELVLANIETTREILRLTEPSDEWRQSWEGLIKSVGSHLRRSMPALGSWKDYSSESHVWFSPAGIWQVTKDEGLSIGVSFEEVLDDYMIGNPWVYLYAPQEWKKCSSFIAQIRIAGEDILGAHWGVDDEDGYAFFSHVELRTFGNGKSFQTDLFMGEIAKRVKELLKFKPEVDKVIRQVK